MAPPATDPHPATDPAHDPAQATDPAHATGLPPGTHPQPPTLLGPSQQPQTQKQNESQTQKQNESQTPTMAAPPDM